MIEVGAEARVSTLVSSPSTTERGCHGAWVVNAYSVFGVPPHGGVGGCLEKVRSGSSMSASAEWEEIVDESTGNTYWWNTVTNESSW